MPRAFKDRIKAESYKVHSIFGRPLERPRTVKAKRSCPTGRFVSPKLRADPHGCAVVDVVREDDWTKAQPGDRIDRVCYPTKAEALRAFVHFNRRITEGFGLHNEASGGEFDSVNERHGLKGSRKVRTLAKAIARALPPGKPYCLDMMDLEMLNETRPGQDLGPFVLPDVVAEAAHWKQYQAEAAELELAAEVPF